MSQPSFQTVSLSRGRHRSPEEGACVIELASMIAGERFSDRPRSVCPVIAAFLRAYNDKLADHERDELYRYAALVVGTRCSRRVARQRARHLFAWVHPERRRRPAWSLAGVETWNWIGTTAAEAAIVRPPRQRTAAVAALLEELLAIGPDAPVPVPGHAVVPPDDGHRAAAARRTLV